METMKRFFQIITACIILAFTFNSVIAQQNEKIDFDRLNNDLSIMEGIIDKLIGSVVSNRSPSIIRSQGFYVPDYGLIFSVPISKFRSGPLFVLPPISKIPSGNGFSYSFGISKSDETKSEKREKEILDKISVKVQNFLGIYADAIGQLKHDDKISVYIYDYSSRSPIQLQSVSKSDMTKFRSGKLSEEQFNSKIVRTSLKDQNEMRSQIDILAYVLDSALKTQSGNKHRFGFSDQGVNGLYLNDFGALFLIKTSYGSIGQNYVLLGSDFLNFSENQFGGSELDTPSDFSAEKNRKRIEKRKKELEKQAEVYAKKVKTYKNSFSRLLGNYGNTLRLVKNNEWVCVMTNWQNPDNIDRSGAKPKSLVMRVRKSDLEDYNRGKISNEDFLQKIKYTEY